MDIRDVNVLEVLNFIQTYTKPKKQYLDNEIKKLAREFANAVSERAQLEAHMELFQAFEKAKLGKENDT